MSASYKFRCSVVGHEKDVRAVASCYFPDGSFISGSRDVTTRVWTPNEFDLGFMEAHCMSGHSNFVSCVCVTPPSDKFPQGLILTGSLDNSIHAYTLTSPEPVYKLLGHEDTVCSLAAGKFGTIISGSWDKTAKAWLNEKCVMTLKGHEAAVWSVAMIPEGGFMLTASADRTIKLWKAGQCTLTFHGHTDCVRGLAILSNTEFLSCSNDATIKRWSITSPTCTHTYYSHSNYIYSLAVLPNGEDFVSVGEDRTLRVWSSSVTKECTQTITHPCESVWAVTVLPNGDVVTGGSDGIIRVFSSAAERTAEEKDLKEFEELVSASKIPMQVGDMKTENMATPEALQQPGKQDGQNIMVKTETGTVEAHQWSEAESRWVKIGEVVGSSGASQQTSGKELYNGKEYDFVFSIDIAEGQPALKLPYNVGDDPWTTAHNFLEKHQLDPQFLDEVANFIIKNSGSSQATPMDSTYTDPFTGASRHIPASGSAPATSGGTDPFTGQGRYIPSAPGTQPAVNGSGGAGATDPFTGEGRYVPQYNQNGDNKTIGTPAVQNNSFFPKSSCLSFDSTNPAAVMGKLKEFNDNVPVDQRVNEEDMSAINELLTLETAAKKATLEILAKMLRWPEAYIFPVLDIFRVAIKHSSVSEQFYTATEGAQLVSHISGFIKPSAPTTCIITALRAIANSFMQPTGLSVMLQEMDIILTALNSCVDVSNKSVQIAICTVLLNYAVAIKNTDDMEAKSHVMNVVSALTKVTLDGEARFRLLVCLGTLVTSDENSIAIAVSLDLQTYVQKQSANQDLPKIAQCSKHLVPILKY